MAQMVLVPGGGIGRFARKSCKVIRMVQYGCTNRSFYHIVVSEQRKYQYQPCIEQVGSFDPMINETGEKLVAFNFERIQHWIGKGALISDPVARLLGLSGYLPMHPKIYMRAWRNRNKNNTLKETKTEEGSEKI